MLLVLSWLQSIDVKLFIQKKEIHIGDIKKKEMVSKISYFTISSTDIHFQTSIKNKAIIDNSTEEDNTKHDNRNSL